jgi:hypothetical protein
MVSERGYRHVEIIHMWNRGHSVSAIGEALDLNKSYVNDLVFDFISRGYTLTRQQMRAQEIRFCLFLRESGMADTEICAMLDIKQGTLNKWWSIAKANDTKPSRMIPVSLRSEDEEVKLIKKAYKKMYQFGGTYHPITIACCVKVHPDRVREVLGDKNCAHVGSS